MNDIRHETAIEVSATPEQVWSAITDPEKTRAYYYGTDILSDWKVGSRWTSEDGDELYLEGELLLVDAPRRIVQTFHVVNEEPAASEAHSQVTWDIEPLGPNLTRVRVTHEGMGNATRDYTEGGWEYILGGLKELLESA